MTSSSFAVNALIEDAKTFSRRGHFRDCIALLKPHLEPGGLLHDSKRGHYFYTRALWRRVPYSYDPLPPATLAMTKQTNAGLALHHLERAIEAVPSLRFSPHLTLLKAKMLVSLNRPDEALTHLESMMDIRKICRDRFVMSYYAYRLNLAGQPDKAIDVLEKYMSSNKSSEYIQLQYANLLHDNGYGAKARRFLKPLVQKGGNLEFDVEAHKLYQTLNSATAAPRLRHAS